MNVEQLQHALYWVDLEEKYKNRMGSFVVDAERCADDIRADLAAMRQPITAEALLADGWKLAVAVGRTATYKSDRRPYVSVLLSDGEHCTTYVQYDNSHEVPAWECRTMYDLRELVRLLGGSQ